MYLFSKIEEKLQHGETLIGSHIFIGTPPLTECMAQIGFDMLWIDMEHTAIGIECLQNNLIAARAGGTASFVRIPWNDPVRAKPVIDMGPEGIIFPYIRTADDARMAIAACEYPPKGVRGYGPLRALEYGGISQTEFVDTLYRKMWRILQIEHMDAVNDLEVILAVEGVDAYIIGPNDLADDLGCIGDKEPIFRCIDRVASAVVNANKTWGIITGDAELIEYSRSRGVCAVSVGSELNMLINGCKKVKEMF